MKGYPEFAAVYDRLRTSELLDYEEKVETARTGGRGGVPGTVPGQASGKYETGPGRI